MSRAPEPSGIAPSDGWYGGGHGDTGPKTEISAVNHLAPGEEVASGYRNVLRQQYYDGGPDGGYSELLSGPLASRQNAGNSDFDEPNPSLPTCNCGQPCSRLMSRSERNPNRWFLKCPKFKDDPTQCKFFVWEDELGSKSPLPPPTARRRVDTTAMPTQGGYPGGGGGGGIPAPYNPQNQGYNGYNSNPPPAFYGATNPAAGGPPQGEGDRSNVECFHCGGKGHWSSECTMVPGRTVGATNGTYGGGPPAPAAGGGGGGGGLGGGGGGGTNTPFTCFKCGQEGHYARDCTNQPTTGGGGGGGYTSQQTAGGAAGGGGGGGARTGTCFKCGEEGHWSRDCPNQGGGGGARGNTGGTYGGGYGDGAGTGYGGGGGGGGGGAPRGGTCFKCGQEGHWSRDCTNQGGGGGGGGYGGGGGGGVKRRYEGGAGYDNNAYGGGGGGGGGCFKCGGTGHWSKDCPNK